MRDIPECLNRRYKILDDLVKDLSSASDADFDDEVSRDISTDPGLRLMCDFWNILKEDPDCNLTEAVQNLMELTPKSSMFQPQNVSCYMAAHNCSNKGGESKPLNQCCHKSPQQVKSKCCSSKSVTSSPGGPDALPLSKVLCNLNQAASFDRKCQGMINDLMAAQKELQDQIQHLEHREEDGVQQLKKADCLWSCMEEAYKKKIQESQERQQELIKKLKEAEANTNKWRKNKKDLDLQMENVKVCHTEVSEKLQQKQNDIRSMTRDIEDYKKRIQNNKKEIDAATKAVASKKNASNDKIKKISDDIARREVLIRNEKAHREEKEQEGNQYIREARTDLMNLNKVLLQKRIENEDFRTEKETLIEELEILSQSFDQCKERCEAKKKAMEEEIKRINEDITRFKAKCIRCHECTDTIDIRKYCTDCPRCVEERDCLYAEDHCSPDHAMDCVCMSVKQKFLDNVFENMYTVLDRQIRTGPGKCVAETVLNCLKRSRNGKLDQETRQILQDFILTTVKKNLNLTIVGGAVKTRCELDAETYKQLMLCLQQVKAVKPPKADKQTASRRPPCPRWGPETECNCPKGPKGCICTKRAPPPPSDPGPCPPQDKEDKGEEKICPHKDSTACGPDCAMHAVPSAVGTDVKAWRPDPCQGPTCMFKNMRAAQCVLGPEALNAMFDNRSFVTAVPYVPTIVEEEVSCRCGSSPTKLCNCKEIKAHPRERIIEEVMGKYFEVKPIDKVFTEKDYSFTGKKIRRHNEDIYVCVNMSTPLNIYNKNAKSVATQNCNILYNNVYKNEWDQYKTNCGSRSKYVCKDMIDKYISHSFDTNNNNNFKADSKLLRKSYPDLTISVVTSKRILQTKINLSNINKHSTISNNDNKIMKDLKRSSFCKKVCTIAQKLIKDVIVFGHDNKQETSKEWISLRAFLKEILEKQKMKVDDNDSENNEIEIKTEYLESVEKIEIQESADTKSLDIDTLYKNKHYRDTKQMKVGKDTQCDKKICGILRSDLSGDESPRSITKVRNVLIADVVDSKHVVHETSMNNQCNTLEGAIVDSKLKADLIKEQFQPLLDTQSIKNDDDCFKVPKETLQNNLLMSSELSKLNLDEHVIELIEDIMNRDPTASVSLKRTKSGHLNLGLNPDRDEENQSIVIKKSTSGHMIIEVEKNTFHNLTQNKYNKTTKAENTGTHDYQANRPQCSKFNKETSQDKIKKSLVHDVKKKVSICKSKRQIISKDLLHQMYINNIRKINIKFKHHSKKLNVQAELLKISSENIAIYVKNGNAIDTSREEFPVLLLRTESSTIYIDSDADVTACNGVASRTMSNGFMIYINTSSSREFKSFQQKNPKTSDVFKLKIKGFDNNITEPPAVIVRTPSGNFDVILEKEFEKSYQQAIKHQKIQEKESYFDLSNNSSTILLNFDKDITDRSQSQKAMLMKSNSGLLKIIVSEDNSYEQKGKRKSSVRFGSLMSTKALGDLLEKLPTKSKSEKKPLIYSIQKDDLETATRKTKSSSDSHLYEMAKMKLHSSQSLLEKSSTSVKKTPSGQYAVILDKNLKKTFINNLLSYLDKSSNGIIPIKRTDSGDITISFDKDTTPRECGSLKITPSGNIYIILDEVHVKNISNNVAVDACNSDVSNISSYHKADHSENKRIATHCNAYPDDSLCDVSKCPCVSFKEPNEEDSLETSYTDSPIGSRKLGGIIKYPERDQQSIKSYDRSPPIGSRSSESRLKLNKGNKSQDNYNCKVQSVCPFHKNRYEAISNELLEISGSCKQGKKQVPLSKVGTEIKIKHFMPEKKVAYDWNSVDDLPHQLPPFLKNITFS